MILENGLERPGWEGLLGWLTSGSRRQRDRSGFMKRLKQILVRFFAFLFLRPIQQVLTLLYPKFFFKTFIKNADINADISMSITDNFESASRIYIVKNQ